MKRRTKETPKLRTATKPKGGFRVIRISQEEWAAKCASVAKRGGPIEPAEFFDRALQLGPWSKAS